MQPCDQAGLCHYLPFFNYFACMNKIILITGATSGIGKACAQKFASAGSDIIITGRRNDRLTELQLSIQSQFGVQVLPLCFDVQDRKTVESVFQELPDHWKKIEILINNAGLALGRDSFDEANMDEANMSELNQMALVS